MAKKHSVTCERCGNLFPSARARSSKTKKFCSILCKAKMTWDLLSIDNGLVSIRLKQGHVARPEPATYQIVFSNPSYEPWLASQRMHPQPAIPRMKPRTVQPIDDEPAPRITREEAEKLLREHWNASVYLYRSGQHKKRFDAATEACLSAMLRSEPDDICCLGFKDAKECRCHREEQASAEKARENELADTPTPKAQSGTWTLVAPDGRQWQGDSPIKVVRAEMRERVPAEVGLARILREALSPPAASDGEPTGPLLDIRCPNTGVPECFCSCHLHAPDRASEIEKQGE